MVVTVWAAKTDRPLWVLDTVVLGPGVCHVHGAQAARILESGGKAEGPSAPQLSWDLL